ncbi:PAS domain S-box protein [candidate division KSB1 bacterium]|nr:PAS domain S-box protein [candidate division KSB1 bacterium]
MNPLSVPAICITAVSFYVGFYHLFLYGRRQSKNRVDLTFAISCFTMALYDLFSVMSYNSSSIEQGFFWQKAQISTLSLIGIAFSWFIDDYLNVKSHKVRNIFTAYFSIATIFIFFDRTGLSWRINHPNIKHIQFPFSLQMTYYEVETGPFITSLSVMGLLVFVYVFFRGVQECRAGRKDRAIPLFLTTFFFCAGYFNDSLVLFNVYSFIYIIEFGYMGIVLLMADSLLKTVVESADLKEKFEESEKKYRDLVDQSLVGIFIVQGDQFVFSNKRLAEIFECNLQDLDNQIFTSLLSPDQIALLFGKMEKWNEEVGRTELTARTKNNKEIKLEVLASRILYNGSPAIQGSVLDITVKKEAEEKLRETAIALERSNIELKQFVSVTSHELQEPLRSVASFIQLLKQKYYEKLDSDANLYIEYAVRGVNRLHDLINDFLMYSRITNQAIRMEPVDSASVLDSVIYELEPLIHKSKAKITYNSLPIVRADKEALTHVFRYLIDNAIKYQKSEQPLIDIDTERLDKEWQFSIQDNGIGIDSQHFNRIFEIFKRLHRRDQYSGTGIGLALCKKLIELHGGRIWVESAEDKGSCFNFTIPVQDESIELWTTQ